VAAITTDFQTILVSRQGSAARLTLNRPEKRNALSLKLMGEVLSALASARIRSLTYARS
jgi:enoyl-CoA hydratase/carnithine racemase